MDSAKINEVITNLRKLESEWWNKPTTTPVEQLQRLIRTVDNLQATMSLMGTTTAEIATEVRSHERLRMGRVVEMLRNAAPRKAKWGMNTVPSGLPTWAVTEDVALRMPREMAG